MSRNKKKTRTPLWMVVAFAGGIVVVFILFSFAQELRRRVLLQQHIHELQTEIRDRQQRIADLQELTAYLKTDAYRQRAAREKLNYQLPGEHVVVVPEPSRGGSGPVTEQEVSQQPVMIPPYREWMNLLFPAQNP